MKAKIKSPVNGYNGISAGIKFVKGEAEADVSESTLDWLKEKGYEVEAEKVNKEKAIDKMNRDELVTIAESKGIEVPDKATKAEIIDLLSKPIEPKEPIGPTKPNEPAE
jgi:hypothetical protein